IAEKRPFDMDPDHSGDAAVDCLIDRGHGAFEDREIVADEGWKQARRPEAPMRRSHCRDGFNRRIVVEQPPAAAVHLDVDKARQQQMARKIDVLGIAGYSLAYRGDPAPLDDHAKVASD